MPVEAVIVCFDNSEFMRNSDYGATRLESEQDAVNIIIGARLESNPETTVGFLTMGGSSPVLQVALSTDIGKLRNMVLATAISGMCDFSRSLRISQMALKHRQDKHHRQRIIVCIGSPMHEDVSDLVRLGGALKSSNIAVDVISFGEVLENAPKLEAFVGAVDTEGNSHLIVIPPGPHVLADMLFDTPVMSFGDAPAGGMGGEMGGVVGGGAAGFENDPDMALAIQMSLQDEERRQQLLRQSEGGAGGEEPVLESGAPSLVVDPGSAYEDEQIRLAIEMSLMDQTGNESNGNDVSQEREASPAPPAPPAPRKPPTAKSLFEDESFVDDVMKEYGEEGKEEAKEEKKDAMDVEKEEKEEEEDKDKYGKKKDANDNM
eukprot:TRINITY_DN314_c0_g1_i1.p1 TRINITY_DN314_c0_g1~~TRINITY_DN314_c0_g1_i1.p1  ORF type:complete len:375 (-),score=154.67 TRINITY_DN314_c0_g1_i1:859-1983(-)